MLHRKKRAERSQEPQNVELLNRMRSATRREERGDGHHGVGGPVTAQGRSEVFADREEGEGACQLILSGLGR